MPKSATPNRRRGKEHLSISPVFNSDSTFTLDVLYKLLTKDRKNISYVSRPSHRFQDFYKLKTFLESEGFKFNEGNLVLGPDTEFEINRLVKSIKKFNVREAEKSPSYVKPKTDPNKANRN
ncbi:MAG TPA: hypothetical protein VFF13_00250 [archaeon]|nr:hypothetical protein [archaeon]